ncbi:WhiB family transcriptional regulator [Streptomyces sp. NPDC060053]|uniref:WhiB family transcriptional regulator n=1 Tax=Streptomyces sp. NPDC060053 TaxID=3347047 RepID=UPI0036AE501B
MRGCPSQGRLGRSWGQHTLVIERVQNHPSTRATRDSTRATRKLTEGHHHSRRRPSIANKAYRPKMLGTSAGSRRRPAPCPSLALPSGGLERCTMTGSCREHPATSDWRDQAACVGEDPEIFFPLSDLAAPGAEASLARAVCRRCAVLVACRDWALEQGEDDGIWGATTAAQRRAIRRATLEPTPATRRRRHTNSGQDATADG